MSIALRGILNRLGSLLLAFLLAVAVWIAASLQSDPFTKLEFANVPIQVVNQPGDTVILNQDEVATRLSVEAYAATSVLAELSVSDFSATMDLAAVEPGMPTIVPITVSCTNESVRIQGITPEAETVHLEYVLALTLPIEIDVKGQVATGYQTSRPTLRPDYVTVTGPEPYLAGVTRATGSIDIQGANEDVVETVTVFPEGADGAPVSGIEWNPRQTEVQIGVRTRVGYKPSVEVVPDIRGDPAAGYRRGSVTVAPSTVTLKGQPAELDKLPGFVMTLPVSITEATGALTQRTPLTVPEKIQVVETNFVTVTVEILPILSSLNLTSTVEIRGLRPGWIATPSPGEVNVVLEGPEAVLTELAIDDVQVMLNLFGYALGVHRVEPDVLAPGTVTVVNVIPETIEVVISPSPTPTPTLTIAPTEAPSPSQTTAP